MIKSVQSIRFYFAITIFLEHLNFIACTPRGNYLYSSYFHNGNFAVTFFFILSGFVMSIGYSKKFKEVTYENWKEFLKKRIKKMYPLYIVTMTIAYIITLIEHRSLFQTIKYTLGFIVCIPMLQSLTIHSWHLFNSAAWFLSCIFILYMVTPFLLRLIYRIRMKNGIIVILSICTYLILSVVLVGTRPFISNQGWILFAYITPYVRIFYYFIGMLIGTISQNLKEKVALNKIILSILEIIIVIVNVCVYFIGIKIGTLNPYTTLVYLPVFLFLIFIFSYDGGIISKFFSMPLNVYLGDISMDIYLIHYIVIIYGSQLLLKLFGNTAINILIYCIALFVVTFILSVGSDRYLKVKNYNLLNYIPAKIKTKMEKLP